MPLDSKGKLREDRFSMEVSKVRWLAIMLKPQRDSKGVVFSFSTLLYPELYQAVSTAYLEWGKRSGWYRFFHRSVEIVSTPVVKEQLVNVGSIGNAYINIFKSIGGARTGIRLIDSEGKTTYLDTETGMISHNSRIK